MSVLGGVRSHENATSPFGGSGAVIVPLVKYLGLLFIPRPSHFGGGGTFGGKTRMLPSARKGCQENWLEKWIREFVFLIHPWLHPPPVQIKCALKNAK